MPRRQAKAAAPRRSRRPRAPRWPRAAASSARAEARDRGPGERPEAAPAARRSGWCAAQIEGVRDDLWILRFILRRSWWFGSRHALGDRRHSAGLRRGRAGAGHPGVALLARAVARLHERVALGLGGGGSPERVVSVGSRRLRLGLRPVAVGGRGVALRRASRRAASFAPPRLPGARSPPPPRRRSPARAPSRAPSPAASPSPARSALARAARASSRSGSRGAGPARRRAAAPPPSPRPARPPARRSADASPAGARRTRPAARSRPRPRPAAEAAPRGRG